MLKIEGLAKHYGHGSQRQTLFDRLSLTVASGELLALLGSSGTGKTSLLNLVSGIDRPDGGTVRIDDVDIHALAEPQRTLFRRHHIGFVFQFFNLIPTLKVGENIALPLELVGTAPEQIEHRVDTLLRQVGLNGKAARYPETLSGGEQQRTAVARALAHRPRLLLADEPTGNLHQTTGDSVIDLLADLAREQDTSLLVVTHSERVATIADRVLRLDRGELLAA
jgi:putative ABC transport system ATP-binding protein